METLAGSIYAKLECSIGIVQQNIYNTKTESFGLCPTHYDEYEEVFTRPIQAFDNTLLVCATVKPDFRTLD